MKHHNEISALSKRAFRSERHSFDRKDCKQKFYIDGNNHLNDNSHLRSDVHFSDPRDRETKTFVPDSGVKNSMFKEHNLLSNETMRSESHSLDSMNPKQNFKNGKSHCNEKNHLRSERHFSDPKDRETKISVFDAGFKHHNG